MKHSKTALDKAISFRNYVSLGIGSMIGMGWIVYTGEWLTKGGPLGAMIGFVVGGLFLVPVGKVYAELTPAIPVAGGEIAFSYKAFGPLAAFMSAWLLAFGYIMICPFETVALGWLLEYILPFIKTEALYTVGGRAISLSSVVPGVAISVVVIAFNLLGVKTSAKFQMIVALTMFLCVVTFVSVALFKGSFSNLTPLFSAENPSLKVISWSILSVLVLVPFWMSGFDAIPQAAEESRVDVEPRKLGTAVIVSIILGICFYVAIILAVSISMPWKEVLAFEMPTSQVFNVAFGYAWAAKLVLIAALLGLITSLNGFFLASTRVLFSAGRGGLLPRWFAKVDEKHHTPKNAILFVGFFALAGPFIGKAILWPIVHSGAFAFITVWFLACLSAIRLRDTAPDLKRPYRVKHKFTLYIGATVALALSLFFVIPGSPEVLAWPVEVGIVSIWIIAGGIFYWREQKSTAMSSEEQDFRILGQYK